MDGKKLQSVVETYPYLDMAEHIMSEIERARVVDFISEKPEAGDLMIGTGGLSKVRIPLEGRGKRAGGRLITYFHDREMPVFLIAVYGKNAQVEFSGSQR